MEVAAFYIPIGRRWVFQYLLITNAVLSLFLILAILVDAQWILIVF